MISVPPNGPGARDNTIKQMITEQRWLPAGDGQVFGLRVHQPNQFPVAGRQGGEVRLGLR